MDGVRAEMLKEGGVTVVEWLERVFRVCFVLSLVPEDWGLVIMIPLFKGKGDMHDCSNYWGISLLSLVGKVYGRISDAEKVSPLFREHAHLLWIGHITARDHHFQ